MSHNNRVADTAAPSAFQTFLAKVENDPIYVVLGVQGSGTNLLRSILANALNFSVVQDQAIVYNAALSLGPNPSTEQVRRQFAALRKRLLPSAVGRKTLRRIKTNGSFEGIDAEFSPERIRSGAELARFIYGYSAFSRGSDLMAIKSDDLWETIDRIDEGLPNRRVILLTRDFRDNLLSICNKDFGPVDPLISARYVKRRFVHYHREYHRTPAAQRIHVRFEDLLTEPDAFVARFRSHFGVGRAAEAVREVDAGKIRSGNMNKWHRLSAPTLAKCEAILGAELAAYGYGSVCPPASEPTLMGWLLASVSDAGRRIPQKIRSTLRRLRR